MGDETFRFKDDLDLEFRKRIVSMRPALFANATARRECYLKKCNVPWTAVKFHLFPAHRFAFISFANLCHILLFVFLQFCFPLYSYFSDRWKMCEKFEMLPITFLFLVSFFAIVEEGTKNNVHERCWPIRMLICQHLRFVVTCRMHSKGRGFIILFTYVRIISVFFVSCIHPFLFFPQLKELN